MVLSVLCIITIIEFIFALWVFKADFLSPAIIFNAVFVVASLDLLIMREYWQVKLHGITLWIFLVGLTTYNLVALVVDRKANLAHSNLSVFNEFELYRLNVRIPSKHILNLMIGIYLLLIPLVILTVVKSNSLGFSFSNYVSSISSDRKLNLPSWLSLILLFFMSAGYVWCYLFAYQLVKNKKVDARLLIIVVETLLLSIANGKRGELIAYIVSLSVMLMLFLKKRNSHALTKKICFIILVSLVGVVLSFQAIATIMGRDSDLFTPLEYFSIYLGAPIMNLDTSIMKGGFNHPVPLSETLRTLYIAIGSNLGIEYLIIDTDRQFLASNNGLRVGNVDTVFYDYYHDGGIVGVIVLTGLMAYIIQRLYVKIRISSTGNLSFWSLLYSYMFWLNARSFFANSFFEWFTLSTLETLLLWWIYMAMVQGKIRVRRW